MVSGRKLGPPGVGSGASSFPMHGVESFFGSLDLRACEWEN
jgi:hypothetical protein